MQTPKQTKKQRTKAVRNEKICRDYQVLIMVNGSSRMGVAQYLAKKYKVSVATVLRQSDCNKSVTFAK